MMDRMDDLDEPAARRRSRRWPRLGRLARVLAPSLATLVLIGLLVFTIFFTEADWAWIAFLSGVLFAAVLSLVSASWKSAWRIARRTAQVARFKELYAEERAQHARTREQLERALAQHRGDAARLARGDASSERAQVAQSLLGTLELELHEVVFLVDRDLRYRFHTRGFADWARAQPVRIDGHPVEEPLRPHVAAALKGPLATALLGKPAVVELEDVHPDFAGRRWRLRCVPHYGRPQEITGVLAHIDEIDSMHEEGQDAYVDSITEELTGWDDPEARVRRAIQSDGFDLYAQDIVALADGTAPARLQEVLIRMRDEEENMLPPGAFLPIVERCGLMPELDRHVVRKALAMRPPESPRWGEAGMLCINLSRDTLRDNGFARDVAEALRASGLPPERLCFEFEDADVQAVLADATRLSRELQEIGCRRSLDGFGSSRVAFEHLQKVPVDFVKIDGRIVFEIGRDALALAKVNAIQRLCRTIGVRTVAEQVESDATLEALRKAGVDYAQGFGIARPKPLAGP